MKSQALRSILSAILGGLVVTILFCCASGPRAAGKFDNVQFMYGDAGPSLFALDKNTGELWLYTLYGDNEIKSYGRLVEVGKPLAK